MFWCKVDIVEGSIIVVDSCQCIRWIQHQKKRLQTHRVAVNFLQNARLRKISWFAFPFALRNPTRACDWNGACETVFSFVSWFRVSNYVSRIWYCTMLKKRSQYRCMSKTYNRTRNVNVHFFLMMMLLLSLNFGRPHKKMTFTYAATQAKWMIRSSCNEGWLMFMRKHKLVGN